MWPARYRSLAPPTGVTSLASSPAPIQCRVSDDRRRAVARAGRENGALKGNAGSYFALCADQALKFTFQLWQIGRQNRPNDVEIDHVIAVNQPVAKRHDLA